MFISFCARCGASFSPAPSETFELSAPRRQLSGGSVTQTVRGYPRGCFDGLLPFVLQRFLFDSLDVAMSRESNRKDLGVFVFRVVRRERLASAAWLRWNVLFWCRSLCVSAEVLSVVEARRFRPCGLAVVAALAQAAHALRVVGVQACFGELDAFDRPMVGYGAGGTA